MLKHLGLDGWQAWDYAIARLYKRAETADGVRNMCDVCGSPNSKEHGETCPIAIAEALMVCELRKCQAGHRRPVVYVAGRFRSADGWKVNENVFAAEKAGREVAALGAMPLVPHSIGAHMAGTEDDTFWLTGTLELMRRCDVVLVLPGYQESQGTMGEIAEAQRIGMPVIMPLDGAPGWEELRSRLKKPKVTVTFKGKEVPLLSFVHGASSLTEAKQPGVVLKVQDEQQQTAELSVILRQSSGQSLVEAARAMRDRCDEQSKEVAGLSIGLGRREGETLLAAARRVRETGTHAEVERLTQLLEAAKQDAEDTRVRTSARIEKLCQESNAVANALGDHHGKTDEEAALALVADLQETRDRHDKVAAVAEKLHKQVKDQARELDELRARHEDTRKQNEVAGQQLGKQDHEALAYAAKRVVQSAEALRQQTEALEVERDELLAKWERTKGELASEHSEHKQKYLFWRSLVNAGPDEALDVAIGKAMMRSKELTSERNSLRAEVTMLRSELATQKSERIEDKQSADEAIAIGKLMVHVKQLTTERDMLSKERNVLCKVLGCDLNTIIPAAHQLLADKRWFSESLSRVRESYESMCMLRQKLQRDMDAVRNGAGEAIADRDRLKHEVERLKAECEERRQAFVTWSQDIGKLLEPLRAKQDESLDNVVERKLQEEAQAGRNAIVIPHRMAELASAGLLRAHPLTKPSGQSSSPEASHITLAGEQEVLKALARPADSSCTCHLNAPCSHCTWYADRDMDEPGGMPDNGKLDAADGGLVMAD